MAAEPHVKNEENWASIPEALLYDPTICAEAVRVYGVLRRHGMDPANCYPSHARIAAFIGKSARSVPGWIRQLEAAGWVTRTARRTDAGDWDSNGYTIYARARKRGVRAGERAPSTPGSADGCAPGSAPNESNLEREQLNENTLSGVPQVDDAAERARIRAEVHAARVKAGASLRERASA